MSHDEEEPLFRELDHTADVGIEVEGDSPQEIFRRAGLALFALMVAPTGLEAREEKRETVTAGGWPDLLHDWLSKLLTRFLVDGFVARTIIVEEISPTRVDTRLLGEKLDWDRHEFLTELKAVTYHELLMKEQAGRWRARIIFDV